MSGAKYSIKAHDNLMRLENRLKRFPYNQPNKTSQLYTVLNLAEGEGTDIPMNVRTGDGLTNGADDVIKLVHLHLISKKSGITWVPFDKADIGKKKDTRIDISW